MLQGADRLTGKLFPCLIGFKPEIVADKGFVEWANSVTGDRFRDHGRSLTSDSPGRLAMRAMLELARAENWAKVAVKGSVRLQTFAAAIATELESAIPGSPVPGNTERPNQPLSIGHKQLRFSELLGMTAAFVVLAEIGFGAAYIYSSKRLPVQLGVNSFIDKLRWNRKSAVPKNPLKFATLSLALSTPSGDVLSPSSGTFGATALTRAGHLRWNSVFENRLAGVLELNEKIEARIYAPSGLQIASSSDDRMVTQEQKNVSFSSVTRVDEHFISSGDYKVRIYLNGENIAEEHFRIAEDSVLKEIGEATKAGSPSSVRSSSHAFPAARSANVGAEKTELALLQEGKSRPLTLQRIELFNTTKFGTLLSDATGSFDVSTLLFVGWQATFDNRLFGVGSRSYSLYATYIAPSGREIGTIHDTQTISATQRTALFTGRVGNSEGGAFLPGTYTVNFNLSGEIVAQRISCRHSHRTSNRGYLLRSMLRSGERSLLPICFSARSNLAGGRSARRGIQISRAAGLSSDNHLC
jgi:hypothetical protein